MQDKLMLDLALRHTKDGLQWRSAPDNKQTSLPHYW